MGEVVESLPYLEILRDCRVSHIFRNRRTIKNDKEGQQ